MHNNEEFYTKLEKSDKSLKLKLDAFKSHFFQEAKEKPLSLQNAYSNYIEKFKMPEYTIHRKYFTSTVDYIFYNENSDI